MALPVLGSGITNWEIGARARWAALVTVNY